MFPILSGRFRNIIAFTIMAIAFLANTSYGEMDLDSLLSRYGSIILPWMDPERRLKEAKETGEVQPLIAIAMNDPDFNVRSKAAHALGKMNDAETIWKLAAILGDSDQRRRYIAADALGEIGATALQPCVTVFQGGNAEARSAAFHALGKIGEPALPWLIEALKSRDQSVKDRARDALRRVGAPAVEPLIAALKDPNVGTRTRAVEALGMMRDPRAIQPLIAALGDSDFGVGWTAAYYGLRFFGDQAVEPLIGALKDPNPDVRVNAVGALAEMNDYRAVDPIIALMKDPDVSVRGVAASGLGSIGDFRAIGPLAAALEDKDDFVASNAAKSLSEFGDERAKAALWSALEAGNLAVVAGTYDYFIAEGRPGTEDVLVQAFKKHCHDSDMANHYVHCGNETLTAAGLEWFRMTKWEPAVRPHSLILWGQARSLRSTQAE